MHRICNRGANMELLNDNIEKAIIRSQHTQRNWDLSREMPQEDIDLLLKAATQCPSKQNVAYYKVHAITNRELIEKIHERTDGFTVNYAPYQSTTNTQVLANLLLVIEKAEIRIDNEKDTVRNDQVKALTEDDLSEDYQRDITRDRNQAIGIAAGYLNLTAALLGYGSGCCACFDPVGIREILGLEKDPILLMGIGFKNPELNRRVHHTDHTIMFPTKQKQEIEVKMYK